MYVVLILGITALYHGSTAQECSTPNSTQGTCIAVKDCDPIVAALQESPLTPQSVRYIRRSQCGFQDTTPQVCCPNSDAPRPFTLPIRPLKPNRPTLISRFGDHELIPSTEICGQSIYEDRILDGLVTAIDEYPWTALLEYESKKSRSFACGGTLISRRYVLTAAHCVTGPALAALGRLTRVRLGEYIIGNAIDCESDWQEEICAPAALDIPVEATFPHPGYGADTKSRHNDIALIRLAESVNFTDFVSPACLPDEKFGLAELASGKIVDIAGWGQTEKGFASPVKLKAKLAVFPHENCEEFYKTKNIDIWNSQICAGGGRKDSCRGDSGGPLMKKTFISPSQERWYLAGVISFGSQPCGKQGVPGIYTKTSDYVKWIRSMVKA